MAAGDYVGARACGEQALTLQRAVRDCENEGMSLHSTGRVRPRLGTYSEVRVHMGSHQAARENGLELRIAGEIDDRTAEGWLQKRRAGIHDKELCRVLLENVAALRQIVAAYQDMQPAPDND